MKKESERLFQWLTNQDKFSLVMANRLYPVVALGDVPFPFSVYQIRETALSKEGDEHNFLLTCYFNPNQALEAMTFNDGITELIKESDQYEFIMSDIDYLDKNQSIVLTINFK